MKAKNKSVQNALKHVKNKDMKMTPPPLPPPPRWKVNQKPWGRGGIFMFLLFYMFQSILNTFVLGYLIGGKKLIIFTDGGYPPPPSRKIPRK